MGGIKKWLTQLVKIVEELGFPLLRNEAGVEVPKEVRLHTQIQISCFQSYSRSDL